jgi:hypothetical protein
MAIGVAAPTFSAGNLPHLAFTPDNHRLVAVTTHALRGGGRAVNDTSPAITVMNYAATPRLEPPK